MDQIKPAMTLDKEQEILKQIQGGDHEKFALLYEAYLEDIYRYVFVIVKDVHKTEDFVSQTFLQGFEKIANYDFKGISIRFWFLKIARNLVYKGYRQTDSETLNEDINIIDFENVPIEELVLTEELKNDLKVLLETLEVITKEIICLRIWEEMKFEEIADFMEMKLSAVKMRFQRGIEKMKELAEKDNSKKLYSFNLIAIFAGLKALKSLSSFLPQADFQSNLLLQLTKQFNLNLNISKMENPISQQAPTSLPISTITPMATASSVVSSKIIIVAVAIIGAIAVIGGTSYAAYNLGKGNSQSSATSEVPDNNKLLVTTAVSSAPEAKVCNYKGQVYQANETFSAGDTCNSCTCTNGEVACTQTGCINELVYQNAKYNYQLLYPNTWTYTEKNIFWSGEETLPNEAINNVTFVINSQSEAAILTARNGKLGQEADGCSIVKQLNQYQILSCPMADGRNDSYLQVHFPLADNLHEITIQFSYDREVTQSQALSDLELLINNLTLN
ncbi:MAG: sigma-70 family RNA polymerase sigma factor [bacterium]